MFRAWLHLAVIVVIFPLSLWAQTTPPSIKIGILAYRGADEFQANWEPFGAALEDALNGPTVDLVPVTLTSSQDLLRLGSLDFLITNPGHYITLSQDYSLRPIATRVRKTADGSEVTRFGSTIVTSAQSDIETLDDVVGKNIAITSEDAFGGFITAWYAFRAHKIDLQTDAILTSYGFPMDQVLNAVLTGEADVAILRSGMIEHMIQQGTLDRDQIRILNATDAFDHPEITSTALYPEWPLLATTSASENYIQQVSKAVVWDLPPNLKNGDWTAPLAYENVRSVIFDFYDKNQEEPFTVKPNRPLAYIIFHVTTTALIVYALRWFIIRRRKTTKLAKQIDLSRRERQVLEEIKKGASSKEIAHTLGISPKTVEFHRTNLLRKYNAKNMNHLLSIDESLKT